MRTHARHVVPYKRVTRTHCSLHTHHTYTDEQNQSTDMQRTVGRVEPHQRAILEELELTALLQLVNANAGNVRVLLIRNEDCRHTALQRRLELGQLLEDARNQGDMAEAVGDTAAVNLVAVALNRERIARPLLGVGGDLLCVAHAKNEWAHRVNIGSSVSSQSDGKFRNWHTVPCPCGFPQTRQFRCSCPGSG